MSNFATTRRFSIAGFVFAAIMTLTLQGSLLMGFDQIAARGHHGLVPSTMLARTQPARAAVTLERVVVTSRRA